MKSLLALLALLSACATLVPDTRSVASQTRYVPSTPLELSQEDYRSALERWPWIRNGEQLHRRALILSLRPGFYELQALDATRDPAAEERLLRRLTSR